MKKFFLFLLSLVITIASYAYDIAVKNNDGVTIYYNYLNSGKELEVTFMGETYNSATSYGGNVVIPKEVIYMNEKLNVTGIGNYAFYASTYLFNVTIPSSVTTIGDKAFYWCYMLKSVAIGNSVESIGDGAFGLCAGLTSITIPEKVKKIGCSTFFGCSGLTSITIPNNVTSIGDNAFSACSRLTSVTIPNSVTSIGDKAFDGENIITVISMIEKPFAIKGKASSDYRTFSLNTFNNATLYVPAGTIDKYKATEGWKDFFFIEESGTPPTPPTPEKCSKPSICYFNGQIKFDCETEGAVCYYTLTDDDIKVGAGNIVSLTATYNISVYAIKEGYENSEVATATLCWIDAEPMQEGTKEAEDGVTEVKAIPVLIQAEGNIISVQGAAEGTEISAYNANGIKLSSTITNKGITTLNTQLPSGSTAIVKIGEKAVKVLVK